MLTFKIITIGKIKEAWLEEALAEYSTRMQGRARFEWVLLKDDKALENALRNEKMYVALDPQGKSFTSEQFAAYLMQEVTASGSKLIFVIGGAEGLTQEMRTKARTLVSLSPLTFTHQLTRLVLMEQIYRALEIARGSAYHK